MTLKGKVYLVGAGIGSIQYLTLQAQQCLTQAEVLIYDALVDSSLLTLVPLSCLLLDVGKRGGKPSPPQSEINQLLVHHCQQGKQVVRLKSGDPLVFGRSNSEIQALTQAGCDFELIPGLSSALTAPLLAGIPLTDKDLSRCFTVLTGHQPELLDWEALARLDTLVILMGGRTLETIVAQLRSHDKPASTPVAIIRDGGRPSQQVWIGTLETIVQETAGIALSPTVIVIGEVIHTRIMTTHPLPLKEKTILVTRAAEQSGTFTTLLQKQGATVIEMPALEIRPPSSWEALDEAIAHLDQFQWLILTSANGVEYFFQRLSDLGHDLRALAKIKIAVVGKKTAATLQSYHLQPDFIPPDFIADSLVTHFREPLTHRKILFPRVETGGREVLVKELSQQGADVVEVPAYQSACPQAMSSSAWNALKSGTVDVITFASSKTVKNFTHLLSQQLNFLRGEGKKMSVTKNTILENICVASIGPQTSIACQENLGKVSLEAKEYTLDGLTTAIVEFYRDSCQ